MKSIIKYLSVISIIVAVSCSKNTYSPDGIYSEGGLISFSSKVATKAPIITELNDSTFGVYGYKFSNLTNWNTAKARAVPNVFHKLQVDVDETGICSYTVDTETAIKGLEQWDLSQKYSFFAYYPYTLSSSNTATFVPSSDTTIDTPYIDYTLPITNGQTTNTDHLLDIMTARVTDQTAIQSTVVRFVFNHRLFCISFNAQNFTSNPVTISEFSATLSGIKNNSVRISMDNTIESIPSATNGWLVGNSVSFPIITENDTDITLTEEAGKTPLASDKNIVLIPQTKETGLKITLNFKVTIDETERIVTRESTFFTDFREGKKYNVTVNFIGDDVVMVLGVPLAWEPEDVEHTFE